VTGIRSAKTVTASDGKYYSLGGTRHKAMQKGINIVDGRKIIVQ
jgi:hypothetical protein